MHVETPHEAAVPFVAGKEVERGLEPFLLRVWVVSGSDVMDGRVCRQDDSSRHVLGLVVPAVGCDEEDDDERYSGKFECGEEEMLSGKNDTVHREPYCLCYCN